VAMGEAVKARAEGRYSRVMEGAPN